MAKININFNNTNYPVDESSLSAATSALRQHLSTVMNGSGATINLGGTSYNIDATKLTAAKNYFVSHLGTIAGSGKKVVVGGVEYGIDSGKVSGAVSELEAVLGGLGNGDNGDSVVGTWIFNETIEIPNKNFEVTFNSTGNNYLEIGVSDAIYYSVDYGDDTDVVYSFDSDSYIGWLDEAYKMITITEEPTDSEFIAWLRANAVKTVIGTWRFNEIVTVPSKNFEVMFNSDGVKYVAIETSDAIYYSIAVGDETEPAFFSPDGDYDGGWADENLRTVNITEQPADSIFITWLKSNAQFIGSSSGIVNQDGYLFYTDNGINYLVGYEGYDTELILPNDYNGENYEIKAAAFSSCDSLTSVTIPDSVTAIGENAFEYCTSLTNIVIGDSVTTIGDCAFMGCASLTSVTLPNGVTSIGNVAFSSCTSLTSVTIPDSVTTIGYSAFNNCTSLTSVYITDIAAWCNIYFDAYDANPLYYAKNLYLNGVLVTDLVIPFGVAAIGSYAFYNCRKLTDITIPDSVTSIGDKAFASCTSLTNIVIGDSVSTIGNSAFNNCTSLTRITIPDSVTSIGDEVFNWCDDLTSVTIPDSVTTIGDWVFYNCTSLTEINYVGTIAQWNAITFGESWNHDIPATEVQCSDGKVSLV